MHKINRYKIITLIWVGLGFLCLSNLEASAQKRVSASSTEEVALAFYRTGEIRPNFESWIKKREPYSKTAVARRPKVYTQELERLKIAYNSFNPAKDILIVRTLSNVRLSETQDKEANTIYHAKAQFIAVPDAAYFPYDFLGERIVLFPYDLNDMLNREISKQQYQHIDQKTNARDELKTIIRMRPYEADFTQPHKIDGLDQWVFKTKIASIEFWNFENELIWEYTAPWYISDQTKNLRQLFQDRPESMSGKKGTPKPVPSFAK